MVENQMRIIIFTYYLLIFWIEYTIIFKYYQIHLYFYFSTYGTHSDIHIYCPRIRRQSRGSDRFRQFLYQKRKCKNCYGKHCSTRSQSFSSKRLLVIYEKAIPSLKMFRLPFWHIQSRWQGWMDRRQVYLWGLFRKKRSPCIPFQAIRNATAILYW